MAVMELWRRRDLEGTVKTEYIDGNFFTQDSVGNRVGVKVYKDGAEVALTGSVTGYCVLPSGETVSVAGTRSGNQASILVPQSALAYTGPLGITLKLVDGNTITTLMSIIVVVYRSKTDTVITPSSQIITDWANQIAAALQEVEDASAAQDEKIADLKSAIVNAASFDFVSAPITTKSLNGITWTANNTQRTIDVNGTATQLTIYVLLESISSLPSGILPGKTYKVKYNTTDPNVLMQVLMFMNGSQDAANAQGASFTADGSVTIPSGCTGITIRFRVASGVTVNHATLSSFGFFSAESNATLEETIHFNATEYGAINVLENYKIAGKTENGITWVQNSDGTITATGTATADAACAVFAKARELPPDLVPGGMYFVRRTGADVLMSIREYVNGVSDRFTIITEDTEYIFGENISGVAVYLRVSNGTEVNETVKPELFTALPNKDIEKLFIDQKYNSYNAVNYKRKTSSRTHNGITFRWNKDLSCNVSGTASGTAFMRFMGAPEYIPEPFQAGSVIKIIHNNPDIAVHVATYKSGTVLSSIFAYSDTLFYIEKDATGIEFRLRVASGKTVNALVKPVILNTLPVADLSSTIYELTTTQNKIMQCAATYYRMSELDYFTYGPDSALKYDVVNPTQIHCGCLTTLVAGGCPYYSSRYISENIENKMYTAGYGFDFCWYSLMRARAGDAAEIAYIGADHVNWMPEQLMRLELFKTSNQLAKALERWDMIIDIDDGTTLNTDAVEIGDIMLYGTYRNEDEDHEIRGGYYITHCDTVITIKNGVPIIMSAGATPLSVRPLTRGSFDRVFCARVPLVFTY